MKDFGFKFKIGETVAMAVEEGLPGSETSRHVGIVCERMLQQCPGGTQRHYTFRHLRTGYGGGLGDKYIIHNEIELVKYVAPKKKAAKKATKKKATRSRKS